MPKPSQPETGSPGLVRAKVYLRLRAAKAARLGSEPQLRVLPAAHSAAKRARNPGPPPPPPRAGRPAPEPSCGVSTGGVARDEAVWKTEAPLRRRGVQTRQSVLERRESAFTPAQDGAGRAEAQDHQSPAGRLRDAGDRDVVDAEAF